MAVFERSTRVDAPLDAVWEFHSTPAGLEALTPSFVDLRVESVVGPDGDPDPAVLEVGSRLSLSVRPFGVGPRQRWTSVIVARERDGGAAQFRDEMRGGPFRRWVHTHRFFGDGDQTVVSDRVEYALPCAPGPLSRVAEVGLEPMFAYRHRETRRLLGGQTRKTRQ